MALIATLPNWDDYPYFRINDNEILDILQEHLNDYPKFGFQSSIGHSPHYIYYTIDNIKLIDNKVYCIGDNPGQNFPAVFRDWTSYLTYVPGIMGEDRRSYYANPSDNNTSVYIKTMNNFQYPEIYEFDNSNIGYYSRFKNFQPDENYKKTHYLGTMSGGSGAYTYNSVRYDITYGCWYTPNVPPRVENYRTNTEYIMRCSCSVRMDSGEIYVGEVLIDPIFVLLLISSPTSSSENYIWKIPSYNRGYYKILALKMSDEIVPVHSDFIDHGVAESDVKYASFVSIDMAFVQKVLNTFNQPFVINDLDTIIGDEIQDYPNYDPVNPDSQPSDDGEGDFNSFSQEIDFPDIPPYNIFNSGMFKAYRLNDELMNSVANYMWSSDFLDTISKLFSDPAETIVVLASLPLIPTANTIQNIQFGNSQSEIQAPKIDNQFQIFDFGNITISHFFGTYADYEGYSDIQIYLPYLGIKTININDVMNSTIYLKYYIDLYSGDTIAYLKVKNMNINSVIYTFTGNILTHLPISSTNYSNLIINGMQSLYTIGNNPVIGALSAISNMSITPKIDSSYNNGGSMSIPRPYIILRRKIIKSNSNQPLFDNVNQSGLQKGLNVINRVLSLDTHCMINNEYEQLLQLLREGVIYE